MKDHKKQCVESHPPMDLVRDILSRLPVKSLIRFRCVCNPWRFLIDNANFAKEQHIRASPALICPHKIEGGRMTFYDFDGPECDIKEQMPHLEFKELASCHGLSNSVNGLICGYNHYMVYKQKYCLLNPSTRILVQLPAPDLSHDVRSVCIGLGFDVSTGNYKLVLISRTDALPHVFSCFVLTMGCDNKWRYIGDAPSLYPGWQPVFVEGVINWIANSPDSGEKVILAFYMKDEKFGIISTPESKFLARPMYLSNCDEHLWLSCTSEECLSIWQLKDYTSQKWTLEYQIDFSSRFSVACFSPGLVAIKGDKLVLSCIYSSSRSQWASRESEWWNVSVYDNLEKSIMHSWFLRLPVALYTESLICPRNLLGLLKEVV